VEKLAAWRTVVWLGLLLIVGVALDRVHKLLAFWND